MKLTKLFLALLVATACAAPAFAHSPGRFTNETLLLIPSRGSALIIIENGSRFDPFVQRLLPKAKLDGGLYWSSR